MPPAVCCEEFSSEKILLNFMTCESGSRDYESY